MLLPLLVLILLSWGNLCENYHFNRFALHTLEATTNANYSAPKMQAGIFENAQLACRINWLQGLLAQSQGEFQERDKFWENALRCEETFVDLVFVILPENRQFANIAVRAHPENAESWFWLASTYADWKGGIPQTKNEKKRQEIIEMYRNGLALSPNDGLRWRELGDLLRHGDPHAAIGAYLQSCLNGDPGSNGCWRAGGTAEALGEYQAAIKYYRLSDWSGARNRADALERELNGEIEP